MLTLKNITKTYITGDSKVEALKGLTLDFRENEFVSILGQSGCGKTTLLNIIGGLDRYTSGDLIINGVSTKKYKDSDWDTYRNHSVGFVFQSYNLIPHQTVLSNVELALTLSGVGKRERRERAVKALCDVGLQDQINKKPNQLSGGQMQRVAIARALVNDPKILLADEPTGALDSETSLQVMEILKKISSDKLIIMVTHNPELAEKYSSRIIKLLDGVMIGDSNPYIADETKKDAKPKKEKRPTMSFFTALSLSLKNLMTKKARTFLTAFAGSIGIIGIALVLSLSNGISQYISDVQEETLSSYPLTIQEATVDMDSMLNSMVESQEKEKDHDRDKIYSNDVMSSMISSMSGDVKINNLKKFKEFLKVKENVLKELVTDVQYGYSTVMNVYKADTKDALVQVNPNTLMSELGGMNTTGTTPMQTMASASFSVWREMIGSDAFLEKQYDVVYGAMPKKYNEIVLIVDKNNEITDVTLYSLGLKDQDELRQMMKDIANGKKVESKSVSFEYEDILKQNYKLLVNTDYFVKEGNLWTDKSQDEDFIKEKLENAITLKIVGIIRPSENSTYSAEAGAIGYTKALTKELISRIDDSAIVKEQLESPEVDVLTGIRFDAPKKEPTMDDIMAYASTLPSGQQQTLSGTVMQMKQAGMSDADIVSKLSSMLPASTTDNTYSGNLQKFGLADLDKPSTINLYAKDFASKDEIENLIKEYNETVSEEDTIQYTDYVGMLMSSITTIINIISYILIAFVAISLVVSSIMIGIITYISVLERTKEIGILRSIGASKRDISRVFNAETLIEGFVAGLLGILVTLLLSIPINAIINSLTNIKAVAVLPPVAAIILVLISMFLTYIAGLIPAKIASKKDPVVALRSE